MKLRLVPESLFGRLLMALLGVIGSMLVIIVVLIMRERSDFVFSNSETAEVVDVIGAASTTLAQLSGAARVAELARLKNETLVIERGAVQRRPLPPEDLAAAARTLRSRLERQLGAGFAVGARLASPGPADVIIVSLQGRRESRAPGEEEGAERGGVRPFGERSRPGGRFPGGVAGFPGFGPRLDVSVTLPDGDRVAFRTDVPRAGPPLPRQIFIELALVTLVLGAVLYLMARTITRPLANLAGAAEAVGRGARQAPLQETGARELRNATRAFNAMQERLHRYIDSRTRVLAAMSHDLRTPLTRLKLRVEGLDDATQRERFNADLDEMSSMVSGALNLFRGLNDDEPPRPIEIGGLLEELRKEFAELGASIEIVGAARAPLVAKPHALKRCLTNLLSNAVNYGTRATVVVEDGAELVLRVQDEGPGIPEQSLEQVFEPFFRLEGSRNAATGGTGLGLSIARDIAQAHGGSLVLRNRAPHGLEAILRLPRANAPD